MNKKSYALTCAFMVTRDLLKVLKLHEPCENFHFISFHYIFTRIPEKLCRHPSNSETHWQPRSQGLSFSLPPLGTRLTILVYKISTNLFPRVFSAFNMAAGREKTLAYSRSRDQICSSRMDKNAFFFSKWQQGLR